MPMFYYIIIGIVHYAGTTHGDALFFCKYPLQYPIYIPNVIPLYMSIAVSYSVTVTPKLLALLGVQPSESVSKSVSHSNISTFKVHANNSAVCSANTVVKHSLCTLVTRLLFPTDSCNNAISSIHQYHRLHMHTSKEGQMNSYHPGIGGFKFSPSIMFP